jgi:hypothetical protein
VLHCHDIPSIDEDPGTRFQANSIIKSSSVATHDYQGPFEGNAQLKDGSGTYEHPWMDLVVEVPITSSACLLNITL